VHTVTLAKDRLQWAADVPVVEWVEKQQTRTTPDGKTETVTIKVPVGKLVMKTAEAKVADCTFATVGGKELTPDDAKKLLAAPRAVLLVPFGTKLDPFHGQFFAEDVLVVALPAPPVPGKPDPPPVIGPAEKEKPR
jgi:hypothetical protein